MALYNLVIQVTDKVNPESVAKDSKMPKAGDLIDFLPAGAELGNAIYRDDHNFWRVLQVDVNVTEVQLFKLSEAGDPKTDLLLQFRAYYLDILKLNPATQLAIAANPKAPIPVTLSELRSAKTQRPKRVAT